MTVAFYLVGGEDRMKYFPAEVEIKKVMSNLGFDYMQARNHLICQSLLLSQKPDSTFILPVKPHD